MGKTKPTKEKKFDRNVEISAPILDPEIIKAIHTPPKGQRLNIKHGGFKQLLSDLNSQDSNDELTPLNDDHVPSYIGISCAVSGYSNYSPYTRQSKSPVQATSKTNTNVAANRSETTSPVGGQKYEHQINHITIDKNNIHSANEELKELTEKLTASATEHQRSPSPRIPHTEDDRHHGAYVGARYCPLPPPSKLVTKHIPLLGIDDEQSPEDLAKEEEEAKKVEKKIATLYGDEFVKDWRESMTHKAKKEHPDGADQSQAADQHHPKSPKDLVTLKPTPTQAETGSQMTDSQPEVDVPTPNVKVLSQVEKKFLNKLLTDDNPPHPSQSHQPAATATTVARAESATPTRLTEVSETPEPTTRTAEEDLGVQHHQQVEEEKRQQQSQQSPAPMSPDSGKSQSFVDEELNIPTSQEGEEQHIEYEIRAQSPVNNESSPIRINLQNQPVETMASSNLVGEQGEQEEQLVVKMEEHKLVSFSPEPPLVDSGDKREDESLSSEALAGDAASELIESNTTTTTSQGGFYLGLLDEEKSFIQEQVSKLEQILTEREAELDEDTVGRIRSAIGKANLLINKKFNQFRELCEANISSSGTEQFATLNDDLAGFWDMLSIQVSDIRKSFETLWQAKESNWRNSIEQKQQQEDLMSPDTATTTSIVKDNKTSVARTATTKLSAQKDQKRRERLQEHINQMKQQQMTAKSSAENLLLDDEQQQPLQQETADNFINDEIQEQEEQLFSLMGDVSVESEKPQADQLSTVDEISENPPAAIDHHSNLVDTSE